MRARLFTIGWTLALALAVGSGLWARPDPPGNATVAMARGDHILLPPGIFAPRYLYPKGRVDYRVVEQLIDQAMVSLTGRTDRVAAWQQYFSGLDTVGLMVDVSATPVQVATVEIIIDRLISSGVSPDRIYVFGGDEAAMFNAGFNINRSGGGVKVLGVEAAGYRGGTSRLVTDTCHALINVASLQADSDLGMAGCVANALACVPPERRRELRDEPAQVPSAAAHPAVRQKLRLNFLEAYLPVVDSADTERPTWQYRGLLAGTDPVAVDVLAARVLQGCRDAVRKQPSPLTPAPDYLRCAQTDFRLGQSDPEKIALRLTGPREGSFFE